jgi:hypothetical protein
MSEQTRGMQFVQKVRPVYVNRDGNEQEAPNIALPFESQTITFIHGWVAAGGQDTYDVTAAVWGAGLDFYVISYNIYVYTDDQNADQNVNIPFRRFWEGFRWDLNVDAGARWLIRKHFNNYNSNNWIHDAGSGRWEFRETIFPTEVIRVPAASTLRSTFDNDTLERVYVLIHMEGYAL